ncbi:DUF6438 domain-containing protein [Algiphilus sp. W345]|uniref:DUF6438 domain-containing protein n=1 Tax=Banduia mediterranea TaxID=3075609 RepID=A0ABU2WMK9_9GAMM|nr:DUF6438 domain-containing protein [Algiphilus sp. W345]MDT0498459.1 DUF6438 domain-containing protein [Algiphilus sp. W345]
MSSKLQSTLLTAAALVVAALCACATNPRPEYYEDEEVLMTEIDPMDLGVSDYIRMQRGPCFGKCPEYIVVLGTDGLVRYKGIHSVGTLGMQEKEVSTGRVAGLKHAVARLGIMQLAPSYKPGDKTCERYDTDMPTVELQVVGPGGGIKRITHDLGCQDAPNVLHTFEKMIDEAAEIGEWVTGGAAS